MRQTIYPAIRYRDADAALEFLTAAFGARAHEIHRDEAGAIQHGQIVIEEAMVFIAELREPAAPAGAGRPALSLYLVVADPDAHHARAAAAGATVTRPPVDTEYGSREYSVVDPEGHLWSFGTYDPSS